MKINLMTFCLKILLEDALLKENFLYMTKSGRIKVQLTELVIHLLIEVRVEDEVDKLKGEQGLLRHFIVISRS